MFEVIISREALNGLEKTIEYYLEINPTYSKKIYKAFFQYLEKLKMNPFIYKRLNFLQNYRRIIVLKRFLIIYRIINKKINVVLFVDGTTNYKTLLKK